jgi:hypothetical protein
MTPTLYLAWLSHPEDGGWFDPKQRADQDHNGWSKYGPLHMSLHTRRDRAEAALAAAVAAEWDRASLAYAHGPITEHRDPVESARRFIGYEAHVTEQPVDLP